jgi:hypothetical protein
VTAVFAVLIGGGAALSNALGDRPGGILILSVLALAAVTAYSARQQPRRLAKRFLVIGLLQIFAAAAMILQGWGATSIVAMINGIVLAGWLLTAALFSAATRESPAA